MVFKNFVQKYILIFKKNDIQCFKKKKVFSNLKIVNFLSCNFFVFSVLCFCCDKQKELCFYVNCLKIS